MALPPVDRRGFLKVLGTSVFAGAALSCKSEGIDPYALPKPPVPGQDKWQPRQEKWITTACGQCAAGCGVRARVVGGRAVKLEGHPGNPINQGGIGPRGLSGLQVLYDPDRITGPLRRKGGRSSREFEPVTWDAALDEVAGRLGGLRGAGEPHRLGVLSGRDRGRTLDLLRQFCTAFGTPNLGEGMSRRLGAIAQATLLTQGVHDTPAHDWTTTRYVLSIGAGVLESSCQAIYFTRAAAHLRQGTGGSRAKIVQVEPSRSRTAAQADEWIGVAPGTQAAFVLGLAHVLVRDGMHDAAFVSEHGFGFEAWTAADGREVPGFRDILEADYSPEQAAATCGVKPEIIERIAGEIGRARPAFALVDERATLATNGLHVALAVAALNALLGSIERPGGVLTPRAAPIEPLPVVEPDAIAAAGLAMPRLDGAGSARFPLAPTATEALPEALLAGAPYQLDTLLLHYSNPLHAGMNPARWAEALAKVPFIVSLSPFFDETSAQVADLILPDHSYLERWEDSAPSPSTGHGVYGIRQPVVEPLHDTRNSADVVLQLAAKLGSPVADALPWEDFEAVIARDFEALVAVQRGSIVEKDLRGFRRKMLQDGFWSDDAPAFENWAESLRTPSGKFEFFSQSLWRRLAALAESEGRSIEELLASAGHEGPAHLACLPHHAAPRWNGAVEQYPFMLEPYEPGTYAEGSGANLPFLQELITVRGQKAWSTLVEIGERAASDLGIVSGDIVEIASPAGTARAPASVRKGMRPDVVRIARGGGHEEFGRFAKGWGINVMTLVAPDSATLAGVPALGSTRVSLRKAGA